MKTYVNEARTVLVQAFYDEEGEPVMTVATREDSDALWGPPVVVVLERSRAS